MQPDPATAQRIILAIIEELGKATAATTRATNKELDQVVRRKRGRSAVTTMLGKDHKRKAQTVVQITQGEKSARQNIPGIMAWSRITVSSPQLLDVHQLMIRQLASGSRARRQRALSHHRFKEIQQLDQIGFNREIRP
jgi:hypothetical protein